jgi:hypothetical protein
VCFPTQIIAIFFICLGLTAWLFYSKKSSSTKPIKSNQAGFGVPQTPQTVAPTQPAIASI